MLSDLRFTVRGLRKSPGFAGVAMFTLALGLGVNTTMFSIVNALLFQPLPYTAPDRLVAVNLVNPVRGWDRMELSMVEFNDLRESAQSYQALFAVQSGTFNVSGSDLTPERFTGTWMSGPGLTTLGTAPRLGRWWTEAEDLPDAEPVVVISATVWQSRFGADPDIIGRTLRVNGEVATIIGVAPEHFDFPGESSLWMPRRYARTGESRDTRYLHVTGRLRDGVRVAAANEEMAVIFGRWQQAYPEDYRDLSCRVGTLRDDVVGQSVKQMLAIMMACVSMVLLIACTNVANLLLVRGGVRARELAIRSALGARRGQTLRLLLLESLLLALGGGLFGLPLASALLQTFARAMAASGDNLPSWLAWRIDGTVLGYVGFTVGVTCLMAGLMPAWRLARPNLTMFLNDAARGSTGAASGRLTRGLVIAEVALACVLLVMSGLMIRSVMAAAQVPLGYDAAGVMTCRIGLPESQYADEASQIAFYDQLMRQVQARPEVIGAGLTSRLPTWNGTGEVVAENSPLMGGERAPQAGSGNVSAGWFNVLRVAVAQGRDFDARDTAGSEPVAVVNALMAQEFWPGRDPIGQRFKLGRRDAVQDKPWISVVGVVPSIYQGNFEEPAQPQVYLPTTQTGARFLSLFLRTTTADPAAAALMRAEVARLDPDLPIYWVQPLQEHIDKALFYKKLFAWIFGLFGGVALILAGVGIYGVMAYQVSQRTQEIGVRMALGASPARVLGLVLRQGGTHLALGLGIGLIAAGFASRLLQSFLYQVDPGDPPTFGATLVVLAASGILACLVPACRAVRVSPMVALRCA